MNFADSLIPQTFQQALELAVPYLTLLIGVGYFLMPRLLLNRVYLVAMPSRSGAIGEGRSSFAGFLIGVALVCLLLQQPGLQQPGLIFTLAACWLIAAVGKLVHVMIDGTKSRLVMARFGGALLMGCVAIWIAEPLNASFTRPTTNQEWYAFMIAIVTVGMGLTSLIHPKTAGFILGLEAESAHPAAIGELRGTFAGFHIAVGLAYLAAGNVFLQMMLTACWTAAGFGRMISMLSDRGNTIFNWAKLLIEIGFSGILLVSVFGVAG